MTSMEDNLNGRQTIWRTTSMEDDINGRQPQWKMTTLACLTSQFCSELGPAQPQLVQYIFGVKKRINLHWLNFNSL